jgi:hypothetical protein
MNASRTPNDRGRQTGAAPGGHPASRIRKGRSQFTWPAIGAGALAVILVAVFILAVVLRNAASAPAIAGTWVGTGTVTYVGPSAPIAYYLDLTTDANNRITGTGSGCTATVTARLTLSGAPGSSEGDYTMDWTTPDLGPGERTLHVSAHVSGSQMTLSGTDPSSSPPTTSRATLTHGSQGDFVAKCNSLPTPAPSS